MMVIAICLCTRTRTAEAEPSCTAEAESRTFMYVQERCSEIVHVLRTSNKQQDNIIIIMRAPAHRILKECIVRNYAANTQATVAARPSARAVRDDGRGSTQRQAAAAPLERWFRVAAK